MKQLLTQSIHILAIAGSLRKASHNLGLLKAASRLLPAGVTLEIFDLTPIPLFNMDDKTEGEPEVIRDFKERIARADALLIATPEYNASIPGVLKNAIDWASHPRNQSPLVGKPLAMLGAGGSSGTLHAQRHLVEIAQHLKMDVLATPQVLVRGAWQAFDQQGDLVDASVIQQICELLQALVEHVAVHQPYSVPNHSFTSLLGRISQGETIRSLDTAIIN
jgi:chromate reductase